MKKILRSLFHIVAVIGLYFLLIFGPKMTWILIGLHLIADFWMQGCLADLKQKDWWTKKMNELNLDDKHKELYEKDYQISLVCHALMWSIITFSPLIFFVDSFTFGMIIFWNTWYHAYVDNLKANVKIINLFDDQLSHIFQIVLTAMICFGTGYFK